MTKLVALFAVSAVLAIALGVAALTGTAAVPTGLTGKVLRGPVTPVCRFDKPCYAPYKGTLVFTRLVAVGSNPAAPVRTQTTPQGVYSVDLDNARYRVTTGARSRFGGAVKPSVVSVPDTGMRRVNFIIDTGIR